jgi:hypothetical protein
MERILGLSLAFSLIIVHFSYADGPQACNEKEDPVVCMLKVERNNSQDELAIAQGTIIRTLDKEKDRAEYWKKWVEGDIEKSVWWNSFVHGLPTIFRK